MQCRKSLFKSQKEAFTRKYEYSAYEDALAEFMATHERVMEQLATFSNDELFTKGVFDWVGGSTLGSYFVSVTTSHYIGATKKIRKFKKMLA